MGQLRDRMEEDLKLGGYSASTRKIYLLYARQFAGFHRRSPAEMSEPEIRQYLLHLIEERKVSRQTFRQVRAGLKFLYSVTLRRPVEVEHLAIPRRHKRLPEILSGTEIEALLAATRSLKYRGILMSDRRVPGGNVSGGRNGRDLTRLSESEWIRQAKVAPTLVFATR